MFIKYIDMYNIPVSKFWFKLFPQFLNRFSSVHGNRQFPSVYSSRQYVVPVSILFPSLYSSRQFQTVLDSNIHVYIACHPSHS